MEDIGYDQEQLDLPESFADGRLYLVEHQQRQAFDLAGTQLVTLRAPAGLFITATLDALVRDAGVGNLSVKLDIGNDGAWDWEWSGAISNTVDLHSPDLAPAFNAYWTARPAGAAAAVDVPVRIYLSSRGQVWL
jgi:hypothetical protein